MSMYNLSDVDLSFVHRFQIGYDFTTPEDTPVTTSVIGTVLATDADAGTNAVITYSITGRCQNLHV